CDDAKGALRRGDTQGVQDQLRALDDRLNDLRDQVLTLKSTAAEQMERADALAAMSARMDVKNFLVDHARETRSALVDTWDSYMAFAPMCESLFNEYVDVLRGIAVREAGFDHELFLIADRLPLLWRQRDVYWQSLTIPSRAERQMPTAGKVLRIGFPEWT